VKNKGVPEYNSLMPPDQIARHYADEMFTGKMEKIVNDQQKKRAEVRADHARRGLIMSGSYVASEGRIQAETIRLLAEARAETLLAAFARAGIPLTDAVVGEITAEVNDFCTIKKQQTARNLAQFTSQTFGGQEQPAVANAVSAEVEREVGSALADISRNLRIKRYEIVLDERKAEKVYAAAVGKRWDVFVSHASEDKAEFVRPLAEALTNSGLSVWYDETTLKVGDSLRREIDKGLAQSRFGVVVLSHSFFSKEWPQNELDGLFTREIEGVKVILPVWHKITKKEVENYSPMLAGRVAVKSSDDPVTVVRQLREAMGLQ
jgi:hypothetical protein